MKKGRREGKKKKAEVKKQRRIAGLTLILRRG